ncbi:histidine--tRNA ligase [Chondrinema litorale]|uniref:histidine--tRNA ligase n=1 Tax=Chondrinema litorale TaxID=2994555 RepID=UPI0025449144|nr:histidine--tRNA ligase [Chondrinema litorale]UZR95073.1 histidine--tRNA ligase [Chondrinema litorale]
MAANKPSIPSGTRDFGPIEMNKRTYILDTIKAVYKKYGFQPLETPTLENLSVLTGKYGDEGDQLLFKVLNSGDYLKKTSEEDYKNGAKAMLTKISEKGLRYDLTVPFARYVVMNRGTISFPFKRFQIQPVWRADRPQKGRYREFYQCDADVIGTNSLICEAEIVAMIKEVFSSLKLDGYLIKINNRKILAGIAEMSGQAGKESELCVAIDKLDKIGIEKVNAELKERGFSDDSIQKLEPVFNLDGDNQSKIDSLESLFTSSETGKKGIEELKTVFSYMEKMGVSADKVEFDTTLARGLSYYTGAIFEVKATDVKIGSITGGGRYDDLTGVFGLPDMSGVGISFGVDRIYDVLEELNLFPEEAITGTDLMFVNFDEQTEAYCLPLLQKLRAIGVNAEIYPDSAKMKKQMNYANNKNINYVALAGSNEIAENKITLKNMTSGDQELIDLESFVQNFKK